MDEISTLMIDNELKYEILDVALCKTTDVFELYDTK